MSTWIFILATWVATAAADSDCEEAATTWIDALELDGCPPLTRYEQVAINACRGVQTDGWSRNQKAARKALFKDCKPTRRGFPGANAKITDSRTLSRCGELTQMVRGESSTSSLPTELIKGVGIDEFMAAISTAIFVCADPDAIDSCRLPATIHTAAGRIEEQLVACQSLGRPPLDSPLHSLAWNLGPMPVIPEDQAIHLQGLLDAQAEERKKIELEDATFSTLRDEEPTRAQELADVCLTLPGEMSTSEQTDEATRACNTLLALWRGDDELRRSQIASGAIAQRYAERTEGKVLNSASLNVAEPDRVRSRPEILTERKKTLVAQSFSALIESDVTAAEALLDAHRELMGPEWTAEATDRVLAAGME